MAIPSASTGESPQEWHLLVLFGVCLFFFSKQKMVALNSSADHLLTGREESSYDLYLPESNFWRSSCMTLKYGCGKEKTNCFPAWKFSPSLPNKAVLGMFEFLWWLWRSVKGWLRTVSRSRQWAITVHRADLQRTMNFPTLPKWRNKSSVTRESLLGRCVCAGTYRVLWQVSGDNSHHALVNFALFTTCHRKQQLTLLNIWLFFPD